MAALKISKINCSEVLPRLYLGDLVTATTKSQLAQLGITDLLTVERTPIELKDIAICVKRYLYISALDHPSQDILSHFEISNKFIHDALSDRSRKVYVHCVAGISRSASFVIAYVMKSKAIPYRAAYEFVLNARFVIRPNEGFVKQLRFYEKMKCTLDPSNRDYRCMALESLVFGLRLLPLAHTGLITDMTNADPSIFKNEDSAESEMKYQVGLYFSKLNTSDTGLSYLYTNDTAYKCANCRTKIFHAINLLGSQLKINDRADTPIDGHDSIDCQYLLVEPQPWMNLYSEQSGIIQCEKCHSKLGKYDWICEDVCNCSKHAPFRNISVVRIQRKKVDCPISIRPRCL